ncbi:MAG TPA: hypothetical protein VHI93_00925 [Candidatus Thermoplasmatota archaeon]|nr:hypothetical protein [Candidatus Thermoplasmatota archaeon]
MLANDQNPQAHAIHPHTGASAGLRMFWLFAGLNFAALLSLLILLRLVQPEWFSYPTSPRLALGGSIAALAISTIAGTGLAWNSLNPAEPVETACNVPRLRRFIWHGSGSGAIAGLIFLLVILMLFYVPRHGLEALAGLLPSPLAVVAGACIGGLTGCLDYFVFKATSI